VVIAMTEAEWLAAQEPQAMLWALRPQPSKRKQWLFAAACCRRIWHLLDQAHQHAVEVVERLADQGASRNQWHHLVQPLVEAGWDEAGLEVLDQRAALAVSAGWGYDADIPAALAAAISTAQHEPAKQAALLRDILGNPFHPLNIDPQWLTSDATAIAETIYAQQAFERLPILADALEDAGCDNRDILDHCRQPGEHVLGCWVVDLLLGKV
jgi:hypothetical protein